MDFKTIDEKLREIIRLREALKAIDYSNPKYDEMEENLHAIEDAFQDNYGATLEGVLQDVHDEYCPDTDVLLPIAYLAHQYKQNGKDGLDVGYGEGVFVEVEEYPGKDTKLALVPGPLRIVLNIGKEKQEVLWQAEK